VIKSFFSLQSGGPRLLPHLEQRGIAYHRDSAYPEFSIDCAKGCFAANVRARPAIDA
jgi:hypothetical protein